MTYFQFHLLFLLPPIAALVLATWRRRGPFAGALEPRAPRAWRALGLITVLALVYTTPWDNYLIARGVWGYLPGRVLFTIGYVPIEEYLFFVLQPLLSGLLLFALARRTGTGAEPPPASLRWRAVGAVGFGLLAVGGALLLGLERGVYAGLILAWAAPVAALQWGVGGEVLAARWRLLGTATLLPTLYLWLADRIALENGIWWISPRYTFGWHLFGLPVEEALFFLVTNVIVVQGLMLFLVVGRRWRAHAVAAEMPG